MIKLLQLLIFGHVHKWEIIHEKTIKTNYTWDGHIVETITVKHYTLQCTKCGNIKTEKAKA
jgi:hypothetical protein